ncbi:MAG: chemoreceptor glutamine deamidase CheD [Pseudomonadota bacterium]
MQPNVKITATISKCLPEFGHINRFFDKHTGMATAKILPGEYYVSCEDEIISTVLGSCISACIRDPIFGVGGMNHFMLPDNGEIAKGAAGAASLATRYGGFAMEHLINDILKYGGKKKNLEFKLFGGARVISGLGASHVGQRNCEFVRNYLQTEGFSITSEDMLGQNPRKVLYYPKSGRVRVKLIEKLHNDTIVQRERQYQTSLDSSPVEGDIELF